MDGPQTARITRRTLLRLCAALATARALVPAGVLGGYGAGVDLMVLEAPATPEEHLDELRKRQKADREKVRTIQKRIEERTAAVKAWVRRAARVRRLSEAGVRRPWLVLMEADKAASAADVGRHEFQAMALVILRKETGIPQRDVFGCDHGPQGGRPPYCGETVTHDRGVAFLRALHADQWGKMNGVHWTQTTWFEKVFRVERLSADLTDEQAHMRVCFGDLAVLRKAYGVREGFRRYNGSGPAAEAYADAAMALMPWAKGLLAYA